MRKPVGEPLEIIYDAPLPPAVLGARRRRRWPVRVGLGVAVAGWAVVFPLREVEAKTETAGLAQSWSRAVALDVERDTLQSRLGSLAAGTDYTGLRRANAALDRQEATDLAGIRSALTGAWSLDNGVRRVRRALALALTDKSHDLRVAATETLTGGDPPPRSVATARAVSDVEAQLTAETGTLTVHPGRSPTPPRLDAADAVLATFLRNDDRPIPLRVLTYHGPAVSVDDLATGHPVDGVSMPAGSSFQAHSLLARATFFVAAEVPGERAVIVPYGKVTAPGTLVAGPVVAVVAALRHDAFWVVRADRSIVELDGTGRTVDGPLTLPAASKFVGEVLGGLVINTADSKGVSHGIDVWDPVTRRAVRSVSADPNALAIAVAAGIVAWDGNGNGTAMGVNLTSTITGRMVTSNINVVGQPETGTEVLSPDGRHLAALVSPDAGVTITLNVSDTTTGAARALTSPWVTSPWVTTKTEPFGVFPQLAWDDTGRWLFAIDAGGGGEAFDLRTGGTDQLRIPAAPLIALPPTP